MTELQILSGSAYPTLAKNMAKLLDKKPTKVQISQFADGEKYVRIEQNVRGDEVFIIQPIVPDVNDNIMELLIMLDALKRASARRINVVAPYLGYSRQDRKALSREPITAKLIANLITTAGANRVCTFDLHQDQIQGFYDIPVDHFKGVSLFAKKLVEMKIKNPVVVAPDVGGTKRARDLANILQCPIAIIHKQRSYTTKNQSKVLNLVGKVKHKTAIIIDDIIDTAGTITNASDAIKKEGADKVILCATHPLLSGEAVDRLQDCAASKILFLNTIPIPKQKMIGKFTIIDIAPILAEMARRIYNDESLGHMQDMLKEQAINKHIS